MGFNVFSFLDELKITSEIHLIVASLPDKNNNVKHVMELAGDLAAKHSGRIQVTVWCVNVCFTLEAKTRVEQ